MSPKEILLWIAGMVIGILSLAWFVNKTGSKKDLFTKYQVITLDGGTFDLDVKVIITDDIRYAAKYIHENNGAIVEEDDLDARGSTFGSLDGKSPIIWLPEDYTLPVANHELFHATVNVLQWAGIPLNDNTEEAYAYEMQQLSTQFYNQIKPKK